ncbi:hypothetical protein TNCV_3480001 [Trichonephila clavipes]|nr:hypothetical protein TNCV_3480001 [Trichonephila clavipes]
MFTGGCNYAFSSKHPTHVLWDLNQGRMVAERQQFGVAMYCHPYKRNLIQWEPTHIGEDRSDLRVQNLYRKLSPPLQHDASPDDKCRTTVMLYFRDVTEMRPPPTFLIAVHMVS